MTRNRTALLVAGTLTLVLIALSSGYGYHRDELYFVADGHHLAWGYPDQGPLTPLIAWVMGAIAPGSLVALRVPSALAAGAIVLVTVALARELGGGPRAELIAAACAAVSAVVLFDGHLLSTSTFDLLASAVFTLLVVRAVRTSADRLGRSQGSFSGSTSSTSLCRSCSAEQ